MKNRQTELKTYFRSSFILGAKHKKGTQERWQFSIHPLFLTTHPDLFFETVFILQFCCKFTTDENIKNIFFSLHFYFIDDSPHQFYSHGL